MRQSACSRVARSLFAVALIGALATSCGDDDDDDEDSTATTSAAATAETTAAGTTASATASTTDTTSDTTSDGPATGSGDVCADREALRSSIDALRDVDLVAQGTDGVRAAVADVKDDLAALRESAGDELRPEVEAVQDALEDLETAAGDLGSGGARAAITAVGDVVSSSQTLLDSLQEGACGSSTTTAD